MATKAVFSLKILDLATPLGCVDEANAITDRRVAIVTIILSTLIVATNPTSGDAISETGVKILDEFNC